MFLLMKFFYVNYLYIVLRPAQTINNEISR